MHSEIPPSLTPAGSSPWRRTDLRNSFVLKGLSPEDWWVLFDQGQGYFCLCMFSFHKSCGIELNEANWWIYVRLLLLGHVTIDGVNTLRPRQNGRHFQIDFLVWKLWILTKISLKFISGCPINNIPSLVRIMAWRRSGDKPLSEPMMVSFLMHICVTRPQWVYW